MLVLKPKIEKKLLDGFLKENRISISNSKSSKFAWNSKGLISKAMEY